MRIRQVTIKNFRGIRKLEWCPTGIITCLVGPGDSTKTTILDAIEYALTPKWSLNISDIDFYNADINHTLEIQITVGEIPDKMFTEDKFGLYKRGWNLKKGLIDEPEEDEFECEAVLTVSLKVGRELEPEWSVITDRHPEGKTIFLRERARLGMVRLGAEMDRDFSWSKYSALTRLSGNLVETEALLADVHRELRNAIKSQNMDHLLQAAKNVEIAAKRLGVSPAQGYSPRLDSRLVSLGMGSISLHDGEVPLMSAGLGTRRLVALSIQRAAVPDGAIVLIDEIEYGLEPHRIRRLLRTLKRELTVSGTKNNQSEQKLGQVIFTSHSPTPILELTTDEINTVGVSSDGVTIVSIVPDGLQGVLRYSPQALLGKKLVICEGETEVGLCWRLEDFWQSQHNGESTACQGVVFINGGGKNASARAINLCNLGYKVAYLGDSDRKLDPSEGDLIKAGVCVFIWEGGTSIEERLAIDLPWGSLQNLYLAAIAFRGENSIVDSIALGGNKPANEIHNLNSWLKIGCDKKSLRQRIGVTVKKKGCFKTIDGGKKLADILINAFPEIMNTDTYNKLKSLGFWCYDE